MFIFLPISHKIKLSEFFSNKVSFILITYTYLFVEGGYTCVYMCIHSMYMAMRGPREVVISLLPLCGSRGRTQVVRLCSKHPYPLNPLARLHNLLITGYRELDHH